MDIFSRLWQWLLAMFIKKELNIAVLGLPNAGKTTFVRALANLDTNENTVPTIGVQFSSMEIGNLKIKVSDLSGNQNYTFLWSIYAKQANIIFYIVDSADHESIGVCQNNLESLFEDPNCRNIPIIVIANKQDIAGCLSAEDIASGLNIKDDTERKVALFAVSSKMKQNFSPLLSYLNKNF